MKTFSRLTQRKVQDSLMALFIEIRSLEGLGVF